MCIILLCACVHGVKSEISLDTGVDPGRILRYSFGPWPSSAGGPVVPGSPFKLCAPSFHVWTPELPRSCGIAKRSCR